MATMDESKSVAESAAGDMLELEHVIGYTGQAAGTIHCHPKRLTEFVCRLVCLAAYSLLSH